jgi:hypothetical protein
VDQWPSRERCSCKFLSQRVDRCGQRQQQAAKQNKQDPIEAILNHENGSKIFIRGKVIERLVKTHNNHNLSRDRLRD